MKTIEKKSNKIERRVIPHAEWLAEGERRFGRDTKAWLFKCPSCGTAQSANDFYVAGFEPGKGDVDKYLGFSCIGRFTKAKGCDWTLGGLFQIHTLEIEFEGKRHAHFEFADAPQAEGAKTGEITSKDVPY